MDKDTLTLIGNIAIFCRIPIIASFLDWPVEHTTCQRAIPVGWVHPWRCCSGILGLIIAFVYPKNHFQML